MSTLLLSLLLIILVGLGLWMNHGRREHFEDAPPAEEVAKPEPRQVDTLARGLEEQASSEKKEKPGCPDMSQYIKLDEIPCWNCSLP